MFKVEVRGKGILPLPIALIWPLGAALQSGRETLLVLFVSMSIGIESRGQL